MWMLGGSGSKGVWRLGDGPCGARVAPGGSVTIDGRTVRNLGPDAVPIEVLVEADGDIGWSDAVPNPPPIEPG